MMKRTNEWAETPEQKLQSLIADESKQTAMLEDMANTLRQMRAKSSFRLALLNQLKEQLINSKENK